MTTKDAIDHLREVFKNDPNFRYTYQSNIAMSFYDEYFRLADNKPELDKTDIHQISNKAADRFLTRWMEETE